MRTKQGVNDLIKGIMIEGSVNVTNLDKIADRIIEALSEEDNLIIPDVSHRRELLIAYEKKRGETILMGDTDEDIVDEIMEAINCG